MRKAFKLEELGCANCAAKMERDINKIDGVNSARISFMTSKLMLDADEKNFDTIVDAAQKVCSSYESDCVIVR